MKSKTRMGILALMALMAGACGTTSAPQTKEIDSHRTPELVISLLSQNGELMQGQNHFVVAFRSAATNQAVDVGKVVMEPSMAMPGMAPMTASVELTPAGETGRYTASTDFGMSGSWKFAVRWDGPAGRGSTSFNSNVR